MALENVTATIFSGKNMFTKNCQNRFLQAILELNAHYKIGKEQYFEVNLNWVFNLLIKIPVTTVKKFKKNHFL